MEITSYQNRITIVAPNRAFEITGLDTPRSSISIEDYYLDRAFKWNYKKKIMVYGNSITDFDFFHPNFIVRLANDH